MPNYRYRAIRITSDGTIQGNAGANDFIEVVGVLLSATADASVILYNDNAATSGDEVGTYRVLANTSQLFQIGGGVMHKLKEGGYVNLTGAGAEVTIFIK